SISEFFGSVNWYPLYDPPDFGVWPLVIATFMIMSIAVVIAVPSGLAIAFFLNQYASDRSRRILKPMLEILAGIPTVVFGFFALYFVSPNIAAKVWPIGDVGIYSGLAAGITVGLMILPMMTTLAEDAMAAVPRSLIEGAYALGATKREVCTSVIFQAGLSGIIAAGVIAMSRAIGETTIVLLAAGSSAVFTFNPGQPMQTMSSFIGFAGMGDQSTDSTGYRTIFAVGSFLFVITFALNVISRKVVKRFREVYE
ncbi:MAG: phosphate ABC transporter permease subunit PstC, partial [Actinomycetota bacterium]